MKNGFDKRVVNYEEIHGIQEVDSASLVEAVDPKPGQAILDAMCGYGAAAKGVLEREPGVQVYLMDESPVQLNRARTGLPCISEEYFFEKSIIYSEFPSSFFDTVVIKMGIHEVPKDDQRKVFNEVRRILKPEGKLVVWDIMLPNPQTQELFQKIIRKKDELAGYELLALNRYFFTEEEFLRNAKNAGFNTITEKHVINYQFSSNKRLQSELGGDRVLLSKLNQYIRSVFPWTLKAIMKYEDLGDDIRFNVCKKIFCIQS